MPKDTSVTASAPYLLLKAGTLAGRAIDDALAELGLTGRLYLLLCTVAEHDTESQLELSRHMMLDPTIVVTLLDDLEGRGLVRRSRHPEDRRRHVVALTDEGAALRRSAMGVLSAAEKALFAGLGAAERRQLQELLRKLMEAKAVAKAGVRSSARAR